MEIRLQFNQNSEYQRINNTLGTIFMFKYKDNNKDTLFQVNVTHS